MPAVLGNLCFKLDYCFSTGGSFVPQRMSGRIRRFLLPQLGGVCVCVCVCARACVCMCTNGISWVEARDAARYLNSSQAAAESYLIHMSVTPRLRNP